MGYCKANRELITDFTKEGVERAIRIEVTYYLNERQFERLSQLYPRAQPPHRDEEAREEIEEIIDMVAFCCPRCNGNGNGEEGDDEGEEETANFLPSRDWLREVLFDDRLVRPAGHDEDDIAGSPG